MNEPVNSRGRTLDLLNRGSLTIPNLPTKSNGYVLFLGTLFLCYANLKRDRDTELDLKTNNWHCPPITTRQIGHFLPSLSPGYENNSSQKKERLRVDFRFDSVEKVFATGDRTFVKASLGGGSSLFSWTSNKKSISPSARLIVPFQIEKVNWTWLKTKEPSAEKNRFLKASNY